MRAEAESALARLNEERAATLADAPAELRARYAPHFNAARKRLARVRNEWKKG
jgi:hypothetical protein